MSPALPHSALAALLLVLSLSLSSQSHAFLAAYYNCYSRPAAVNDTLFHFRKHYPLARVHMFNDNGDRQLSLLAQHYRAKYTYSDFPDRPRSYSPDGTLTIIERMFLSLGHADWLLILEDDTRVYQQIDLHQLHFDINGDNKKSALIPPIMEFIKASGSSPPDAHYGGAGGSSTEARFCAGCGMGCGMVRLVFRAADTEALSADVVLSALVYLNNGTIGSYDGYTEYWYEDREQRLAEGKVTVLHMDKSMYDKNFSYDALGSTQVAEAQ